MRPITTLLILFFSISVFAGQNHGEITVGINAQSQAIYTALNIPRSELLGEGIFYKAIGGLHCYFSSNPDTGEAWGYDCKLTPAELNAEALFYALSGDGVTQTTQTINDNVSTTLVTTKSVGGLSCVLTVNLHRSSANCQYSRAAAE